MGPDDWLREVELGILLEIDRDIAAAGQLESHNTVKGMQRARVRVTQYFKELRAVTKELGKRRIN